MDPLSQTKAHDRLLSMETPNSECKLAKFRQKSDYLKHSRDLKALAKSCKHHSERNQVNNGGSRNNF